MKHFGSLPATPLGTLFPSANPLALDLLSKMLQWVALGDGGDDALLDRWPPNHPVDCCRSSRCQMLTYAFLRARSLSHARRFNPAKRISVDVALQHPFLAELHARAPPATTCHAIFDYAFEGA